ncbi:hypothetical protein NEISICOT_03158 [Neisseria sicca ATCC 29256]|uniref:Uncharacterized protein n=1 Tax=Neisseria sicca ATCC 29256 TaxID=547045 RepID=C6M9D3_NEISI|nr:hypothetical protein NEISICOT_03158 [Neisseria sicca ATCC 29256]
MRVPNNSEKTTVQTKIFLLSLTYPKILIDDSKDMLTNRRENFYYHNILNSSHLFHCFSSKPKYFSFNL